jgi:[protein-PII] uridylyltransferase
VKKAPSPDFIREFTSSMPRAYQKATDDATVAEHAGVALRRGDDIAYIELLTPTRGAPSTLLVVADDRPGLLATISAAFVLSDVDVIDAEAHTRRTSGGRAEAVDVFWVRRAGARKDVPVAPDQITEVQVTLAHLLEGKLDRAAASQRASLAPIHVSETIVRFLESKDGDLSTLEVETDDRSGLLLALAHALFEQNVQIEESEVRTVDSRVFDRFHIVELDGKPINPTRRLEIQVAILSAIQPTGRAAASR